MRFSIVFLLGNDARRVAAVGAVQLFGVAVCQFHTLTVHHTHCEQQNVDVQTG